MIQFDDAVRSAGPPRRAHWFAMHLGQIRALVQLADRLDYQTTRNGVS